MKVVVFAYHGIGSRGLEALLEAGVDVAALFTHRDDPQEEIWFRTPASLARAHGIAVFTPEDPNRPETVEQLRSIAPDFLFSFYYRQLLGEEILRIPKRGALNLHGSLLPKYRGRAPINWVLVYGEKETGMTLHDMVKRADAGDIVAQKVVPIAFEDTAKTLALKMEDAASDLLRETLPRLFRGEAKRRPQDESQASKMRARKPEDGRIDWKGSALSVYNLIRAVTHPYPGAFTTLGGKKWFLWWGLPQGQASGSPGKIALENGKLFVEAASGRLEVIRCQLEGAKEMDGAAFAKAAGWGGGEFCGS